MRLMRPNVLTVPKMRPSRLSGKDQTRMGGAVAGCNGKLSQRMASRCASHSEVVRVGIGLWTQTRCRCQLG